MKNFVFFSCLLLAPQLYAHDYVLRELRIGHPYAVATMGAQTNGAAYLSLENRGQQVTRLLRASSPVAARVEIHHTLVENNVARMRPVEALEIKPAAKVAMAPGSGYHVMLVGLKQPLKDGDRFPLLLEFSDLGQIEVVVFVQKSKDAAHSHEH